MIDHCFHVLRAFPGSELSVRTGTLADDPLDVRHFSLAAEFLDFGRDEVEQFVQQAPFVHFGFPAEIDQFPVDTIARRAPAVLIQKTPPIDAEGDVLVKQFVQL